MHLLILQLVYFLSMQFNEMFDEIKEISGSEEVELLSCLLQSEVQVAYTIMHSYNSSYHCSSPSINIIRYLRFSETFSPRVNVFSEFFSHLDQSLLRPISKPINNTSIEQGRRTGCTVREVRITRIHGEYHMQITLDILDEGFVKLVFSIYHLFMVDC